MIKLKTGVSTSLDFVKAMKERGQDVNPMFPPETLRAQLDDLSEEVHVTYQSNNETILQVVNDNESEEFDPGTPEADLDFNYVARLMSNGELDFSDFGSILESEDDTFIGIDGSFYIEYLAEYLKAQGISSGTFKATANEEVLEGTFVYNDSSEDVTEFVFVVDEDGSWVYTVTITKNSETGDYVVDVSHTSL